MIGMQGRLWCIVGAACLAMTTVGSVAQASSFDIPAHVDNSYPHSQPPYPPDAQLNGEEGTVTLGIQVSPGGQIRKARILASSGFDDLDNDALEGVMGWHFLPAVKDGDTVTDWATVKIVYQLQTLVPAPTAPPAAKH